ncbi:MAG: ATP-binding protein [bacterium]|nr:ATP-binding protein [bacterium]
MMDEKPMNNPFPGLRPFEEHEESYFFGREKAVTDLMSRLRGTRFLPVIGASGSGKSSLITAGLLPALYRGLMVKAGSHWRVALFRPGDNPIGNLIRILSATGVTNKSSFDTGDDDDTDSNDLSGRFLEATLKRSDRGLIDAVKQAHLPPNENLLIVVDQFEELFRFSRLEQGKGYGKRDSAAFIKLLLETRKQTELPIYIILTMRSDFLGDCTAFSGLAEAINDGQYLIPRMTRQEKRAAVSGPVKVAGGDISTPLMSRLLNDVGDNPDQLPILQHALMRTWDYHDRHHEEDEPLDIHHYEAVGGMEQALSQHAEEAYGELKDETSRLVCRKLFKLITDTGETGRGIRRPARVEEICLAADASREKVIEVVDIFRQPGRTFLMPPHDVGLTGDSVIDISHESFMRIWSRLTGWVKEEGQSAELYGRLATSAALYEEGKVGLWRDPELMLALKWRQEEKPNSVWARRYDPSFDRAVRFLDASKEKHDREIAEKERAQLAEKKKKY